MSEDSIEDQESTGDKLQHFSEEPEAKSAEKKETSSIRFEYAQNESCSTDSELNIENNSEDSLGSFEWIDYPDLDEIQIAGFNKKKLLEMSHFCKITYGNNDSRLSQLGYKTRAEFIDEGYNIIPFYYTNKTLAGFVFTKDKEITIAYRGTQDFSDIIIDMLAMLTPLKFLPESGRAHYGFYYSFYDSLGSLSHVLKTHVNEKKLAIKDFKFYLTGHSMGGAIAKIAALFLNKKLDVQDLHVATFADPRVFDLTASEIYNKALPNKTIRVVQHRRDPVPAVAPGILGYVHVGEQLRVSVIPGYTAHKIDGYHQAINMMQESDFQPDNSDSILYYPVRLFILINDVFLGSTQYYTANLIRYYFPNNLDACFNAIEDTRIVPYKRDPISTITFNPLDHNIQLKMPIMLEVRKFQSISIIKGNNFQLGNNFHSPAKTSTSINNAVLVRLFNDTGVSINGHFGKKVEFVIQGSSFSHNNNKIKAIQNSNLVEVNNRQKNDNLIDNVSSDEKRSVHQSKMQRVNHTQNLEEPIKKSNAIQNDGLNNQGLGFEDSNITFDNEQAISALDKGLLQLVKFQELYRKYSKSVIKTPIEKRLTDNYREFTTSHPDINLGRSNVANLKTICAHGTNAWTIFSAFAFTNLQLLLKFAMKVRRIPIGAGELISEKEKAKFYRCTSYPNTISQNFVSTVWLGSKDSALAEVFDYADKSVELYKRGYNKFKEKLLKKWGSKSVVQELKEALESDSIGEVYECLSSIPIVIIGDGIGGVGVGVGSSISGEIGYERVNIRIIAIPKVKILQIFIQKLIEKINPKKFKDVTLLTIEELVDFEENRPKKKEPTCWKEIGGRSIPIGVHKNTFIHDFLNTFGDKLPFNTSDKFDRIPIKRTTLTKKEIKGELSSDSASVVGYYKANPDISVTYDEEDSSYLNAEVVSNLHPINKQECDKKEDIQQSEIQPIIIENFNSTKDLSSKPISYIEQPISDVSSSTMDDDQVQVATDNKTASNKQSKKTSSMKKAMYATMIASPFIAVGVYAAVALSVGIVEFNPVIAAGIFVGVVALLATCFAIMKICEKVGEEKDNNPNIGTLTAIKSVFTPECFKNSEVVIS